MGVTITLSYGVQVDEAEVVGIAERHGVVDAEVSIAKKGEFVYYETTMTLPGRKSISATDREVYRSVAKAANEAAANCLAN